MSNEKYYGYTNYATWAVKKWLDENPLVGIFLSGTEPSELANILREFVTSNNPLSYNPNMYGDLLNAVIGEVNFAEIAEKFEKPKLD